MVLEASSSPFDRRRFLTRAMQLGTLAVAGGSLAACGSSSSSAAAKSSAAATDAASTAASAAATAAALGTLKYQLAWIKNVEFAGTYIADTKGYFKQAGFSAVNLISGGPSATPAETVVVTKKALVGTSSVDATAAAILKGAPLKVIGAQYQKNPFAIMSLASKPIKTPQDMIGKSIGVQADNDNVYAAFLKANNLDPSKITKVPVQFDPLPLAQGKVDGWFSFITNEPIDLKEKGYATTTFLLADYNYPLIGNAYMAREDSLTSERAALKGFLKAEIMGWKDALADPGMGASLTTETYGKGLGLATAEQTLEAIAENALITSSDTATSGIFTVSPALQAASVKTLAIGGSDITTAQLFDMSLLEEVYKENPTLI